ncbi:adenine-specific methyltransferase EcoRI family protein [Clostridium sp. UBA4548]|uniref:adenine-specific methyltransferase EcoRI family protein n=1 Tax=Clostridium sp. UBA4548 TaxID=1946361 RepID=UPI0025BE3B0E|nr:adenine-specific methyltransferase EcoRI family protein [Clostridium sp. UBA4548]
MANSFKDLNKAKANKNDEFYTRLADIELEMNHYKDFFKEKVVLCNCDDPYESNFFKYFSMNFNYLGLKKLIATCYGTSPIVYTQLNVFGEEEIISTVSDGKKAYKIEITEVEDLNADGAIDLTDVEQLLRNNKNVLTMLNGDGDFRSDECIELLKECDIVVTNPPFSLFRAFITTLTQYEKDFIIIGNTNSLTYKELFPLIRADKARTGYTNFNTGMFFEIPDYYEVYHHIENGKKIARVASSCWITTLPVKKHKEFITLYKRYSPNAYIKYDNYDAIDIGTYTDIPCDYDGIMGVPITFLDKLNPEQFELLGVGSGDFAKELGITKNYRGRTDLAYTIDGKNKCPFGRILIRNKTL